MDWITLSLLMIVVLLILMAAGVPVAACLGVISAAFLIPAVGLTSALSMLTQAIADFWSSWSLLPVPLFILMGYFMVAGDVAKDIFDATSKWLTKFRAGGPLVTIASCALFGTLSGSTASATATIGMIALPEMKARGYSDRLAGACVVSAGPLAHLIPPSILAVVYASIAQVPVGHALIAGLIPGFFLASLLALVAIIWLKVSPGKELPSPHVTWTERLTSVRRLFWPAVILASVLGAIIFGIATTTEAAAFGAFASFLVVIVRRKLNWSVLNKALMDTVVITAFIHLMGVGGKILSLVLSYQRIPFYIADILVGIGVNPWLFFMLMVVMYIILGMFLEPIGQMLITVPILLPALNAMGFDLIWFGVFMLVTFEIAVVTPPFGPMLYLVHNIAPWLSITDILMGYLPFMAVQVGFMFILMAFPQLATWLPKIMLGS